MSLLWREVRELGGWSLLYRISWELRLRLGLLRLKQPRPSAAEDVEWQWPPDLRITAPAVVRYAMTGRLPISCVDNLERLLSNAENGRLLYFGRWFADCGKPVDWHKDPTTGERHSAKRHWTRAILGRGDIKLTWEMGRFPQAYYLARAATLEPALRDRAAAVLATQMAGFIEANPFELGPHWASSQEIAVRVIAWCFALNALGDHPRLIPLRPAVQRVLVQAAVHVEHFLEYSRYAVRNNHLIMEALVLYLLSFVVPEGERTGRWRRRAEAILETEAERQFYPDGGYIMQSHNYQRAALQCYLLAIACARAHGLTEPQSWTSAVDRSVSFLLELQDGESGLLPNYGANDGSLPVVLSTCDRADFRPTLQAASYATRKELLYEPGPWDEEVVWLFGSTALSAPLGSHARKSVHRADSGHVVLRGRDQGNFATLRCGSIRHQYSQMDMLHVDVWWRGQNVLADPGTFSYHDERWHRHFQGTESHNTVMIDGRDQMVYRRRFQNLYWTQARVTKFKDETASALATGEHYGFRRFRGRCLHRRSLLMVKDFLWIIVDLVEGRGEHDVRCQWLSPMECVEREDGRLELQTTVGPFWIAAFDGAASPVKADVATALTDHPRGWVSRYYGYKDPALSLVFARRTSTLPLVTIASGAPFEVSAGASGWHVTSATTAVTFRIDSAGLGSINVGSL